MSSFVGECVFASASNVCAGQVVESGHKNGPGRTRQRSGVPGPDHHLVTEGKWLT